MPLETTLTPNAITLLEAKQSVCRTFGGQGNTDEQAAAGEAIRDSILHFNSVRDWKCMRRVYSVTNVTGATVTVPTTLKKVYAVKAADYTLTYINKRDQLRQLDPQYGIGGVYAYDHYNLQSSGHITLIDPPSSALSSVTVWYIRNISLPTTDGDPIDVPQNVMSYILAESKSRYLAEKGGEESQMAFWDSRAQKAMLTLVIDDEKTPDEDAGFTPFRANSIMNPLRGQPDWYSRMEP